MQKQQKQIILLTAVLLCLLAGLSACNLPRQAPGSALLTPTMADSVESAVRQTLTAAAEELAIPTLEILLPTNTPPATLTPQPTQGPTETPPPTATPEPTLTPTGYPKTMTGDPSPAWLLLYFDAINREDYATAWDNLTLAYRKNMHYNWLPNFIEGYQKMDLCEVEVNNISIITDTPTYVKMFAQFIYKTGAACTPYPYYFEAHFNYDPYQNRWFLDGLTEVD